MTSTGGLTFNLNQVNPEANAATSSIQSAVNAIGSVAGNRTINLGPGTYTGGTITIDRSLDLNGTGASTSTLSGNNAYRVLTITPASVVNLSDLTIANGRVTGYSSDASGGGIYNGGTLAISNSTLSGNSARYGGGIYNHGTLTLTNSTLSGNSAIGGGGLYNGSGGTLTITNSILSGNSGWYYGGGGIYNNGTLTITNSTLSHNFAYTSGGGIYNIGAVTLTNSTLSHNSAYYGGGISNGGTLTITNSTFNRNSNLT